MADGLNRVFLLGNLGEDPELRYTQAGTAVLNLRLATNESYISDGQRKERTDWHNVVVWAKRAEGLAKILSKGDRILIEGSIRTSSYEARDGSGKRYRTEVHASNVVLSGSSGNGQDNRKQQGKRGQQPRNQGKPQQRNQRPQQQRNQAPVSNDDFQEEDDDDIPF